MDQTITNKILSYFGIRLDPPRNDFRNPIWGSDDEDDDDDELYNRQQANAHTDPLELHQEIFANQLQDMFKSFGSIFGDMKSLFQDDHFDTTGTSMVDDEYSEPEHLDGKSLRDYYLKPGYPDMKYQQPKEDIDLDGKISSQEISGLLKQKKDGRISGPIPFNGNLVPGRSFCQTIITTRVKKPDGSVETKKIVKNGHEVVEETTTTTVPDANSPLSYNMDSMTPITHPGIIYSNIMSELSSFFQNFH